MKASGKHPSNVKSFMLTAVIMFVFWILLSGEFTFVLILSGIISSLLVSYWSHDLLIGDADIRSGTLRTLRFIRYLPWLLWQIVLSNFDLAYRTLHPRMPIDPVMISFKNELRTEIGMVTLANSITLTPGTVTIEVSRDEFIVHAIAGKPAEGLLSGEMLRKVKEIEGDFGEGPADQSMAKASASGVTGGAPKAEDEEGEEIK